MKKTHYIYNETGEKLVLKSSKKTIEIKESGAAYIPGGIYAVHMDSEFGFTWGESRYIDGHEIKIDTDGTFYSSEYAENF